MTDGPGVQQVWRARRAGWRSALITLSLAERPDLRDALGDHNGAAWPEFMLQDPVADRLWHHLDEIRRVAAPAAGRGGRIVAAGNSAPLAWDGTDAGLPAAGTTSSSAPWPTCAPGRARNTLGALQIVVDAGRQGEGLSARMVEVFRARPRLPGSGADRLRAADRKHRYPLTPIGDYAPGPGRTACRSMPGSGSTSGSGRVWSAGAGEHDDHRHRADWERWTGLAFPESGP